MDARSNSAEFAKQLGSTDPLFAARSAEALASCRHGTSQADRGLSASGKEQGSAARARLGVVSHGPIEALYRVVKDLDSGRQEQAIGYLAELVPGSALSVFETTDQRAANQCRFAQSARTHRRRADSRTGQSFVTHSNRTWLKPRRSRTTRSRSGWVKQRHSRRASGRGLSALEIDRKRECTRISVHSRFTNKRKRNHHHQNRGRSVPRARGDPS